MSCEQVCSAILTIEALGIALQASLSGDFASQVSEAPRQETPCQVESGTVVSHTATRPCGENIRAHQGCGTPVATAPPRTVSRLQPRVATDSEDVLRPGVGEGRNNMLGRGRCTRPVSESVHDRDGSSGRIEDQNRTDWEQIRVSPLHSTIRGRMASV